MDGFADWDENSVFLLAAALPLMAVWGCAAVAMDHVVGRFADWAPADFPGSEFGLALGEDRGLADRSFADRRLADWGLADHGGRRRRLTDRQISSGCSAHESES